MDMGEVRAKLILENQGDRVLAEAGHLESARVRRVELDALVDRGAVLTLLPEDVVDAWDCRAMARSSSLLPVRTRLNSRVHGSYPLRWEIDRWIPIVSWDRRNVSRWWDSLFSNGWI